MKFTAILNLRGNNIGNDIFLQTDATYLSTTYAEGVTRITRSLWEKDGERIVVEKDGNLYRSGKNFIHRLWLRDIKPVREEIKSADIFAGARFMLGDHQTYMVVIETIFENLYLFGGRFGNDFCLWSPEIPGRTNASDNDKMMPFTKKQALAYLNRGGWEPYQRG